PGSVRFGTTPWATQNFSHIIAEFRPCPDFETKYPDRVTVQITNDDARSALPLTVLYNTLTFNIIKSPGAATFPNATSFHESHVRVGGDSFSFDIKLVSERWTDDPTNCFRQICDSWTTTTIPNVARG